MAKQVVIFLHGVGSQGSHFSPVIEYWQQRLPEVTFVAPNAPFGFAGGQGYQWFSLDGISEANRPERVKNARESLDATLSRVLAEHQASFEHDQVVLVGFSQGSIMALDVVASGRLPVSGVVAYSGRLASPEPYAPKADLPILLVHGKSDPVIAWQESERAESVLSALGVNVQSSFEQSTVHTVSQQGADTAAEFIAKLFQAA
ncbi:phospholipase/carboxylesterase [Vibrio xiamenensis]|uniref:Phospholipase/carboxylesterase n=2 Tax=Vibrio xiamenensis TaxID=861298 RepID=A0A1G7WUG4_9VIBR|nr:phospholipase/carboxylesterase [Vibrio xiamenensis]